MFWSQLGRKPAPPQVVRAAYRELAKLYHPDLSPPPLSVGNGKRE